MVVTDAEVRLGPPGLTPDELLRSITQRQLKGTLHICGCMTHFDEDRWTSVTDSQCEFHKAACT